eukprot:6141344-Alexandrium_andersonii.AAC.1
MLGMPGALPAVAEQLEASRPAARHALAGVPRAPVPQRDVAMPPLVEGPRARRPPLPARRPRRPAPAA